MFAKLPAAKVVRLFTHALLERRIIFFADQYATLHIAAECLCALLFPFYWQVWDLVLPSAANLEHECTYCLVLVTGGFGFALGL